MNSIDAYIARLAGRLRGPALYTHRVLSEAEAHLSESRDSLLAAGWDREEAAREAIRRFGTAEAVAAAMNRDAPSGGPLVTVRALVGAAGVLAGVGLITVGVSAVASFALSRVTSVQQVFGLPRHASVPEALCAHWLAVQPSATTCTAAAALEARDDGTLLLGALGIIGVVVLLVSVALRRRVLPAAALSPLLVPTVAVTMFTGAAAALAVLGATDAQIGHSGGQGRWFIEAGCALVAATIAALTLQRNLRGAPSRSAVSNTV